MDPCTARPIVTIAFSSLLLVPGYGQPRKQPRNPEKGSTASVTASAWIGFGSSDRSLVRDYVRGLPADGLPPGLSQHHRLPPGLEKQLRRHGRLPPGLEKKLTPFPADLEARLAPLPQDCARAFLSGRAVIFNRRSQLILDAFMPF
jgi:hypothetical protein